jgi:hypothetical protein
LLPPSGIAQAGLFVGGGVGELKHSKLQFILGPYECDGEDLDGAYSLKSFQQLRFVKKWQMMLYVVTVAAPHPLTAVFSNSF